MITAKNLSTAETVWDLITQPVLWLLGAAGAAVMITIGLPMVAVHLYSNVERGQTGYTFYPWR